MSYREGIIAAIAALKDRQGSSTIAIKKHMQDSLPKDKKWLNATFLAALKHGVSSGDFVKVKNSFKLSADFKKTAEKKAKAAAEPKKPKAASKAAAAKKKTATGTKKKTATTTTTTKKPKAATAPKKKATATTTATVKKTVRHLLTHANRSKDYQQNGMDHTRPIKMSHTFVLFFLCLPNIRLTYVCMHMFLLLGHEKGRHGKEGSRQKSHRRRCQARHGKEGQGSRGQERKGSQKGKASQEGCGS
jgi:histone H1/5